MARRSIDSRMDRILNRILPPGSYERRVYDLPSEMRAALQLYEEKSGAILSAVEKRAGPGAAYERLLDGDLSLPAMPVQLRDALGLVDLPALADSMALSEIAEVWQAMIEGDRQ